MGSSLTLKKIVCMSMYGYLYPFCACMFLGAFIFFFFLWPLSLTRSVQLLFTRELDVTLIILNFWIKLVLSSQSLMICESCSWYNIAAQALRLPLLPPYLARGKKCKQGVNFAVAGATRLNPSFFAERVLRIKPDTIRNKELCLFKESCIFEMKGCIS